MQNLTISLHDGMVIDASLEAFDVNGYTNIINEPQIQMLTFGKNIVNKNIVQYLFLSDEREPNVNIVLQDGTKLDTCVENFDENAIANGFNNPRLLMIAVGNAIVNKNIVKLITPITQ